MIDEVDMTENNVYGKEMNEQRKKLCVRDCSGGAAVPERLLGAAEWSGSGTAESPTCRKAGYAHKLIPRI